VLSGMPPQHTPGFLERMFAAVTGKDLEMYFEADDRMIIDDFLTQIMTIDPERIQLPRLLLTYTPDLEP